MIKNVVFDIGNVLAGFQWETFYESFGFSEEVNKKLAEATVSSPFWNELDRGVLSEEEILDGFIQNDSSIEKEIRQIFADIDGMLCRFDYAIPWLKELKERGYKVYYISNFARKAHRECASVLDFLEEMDGGIMSYQVQMIKPDPAIYELLFERYDLKAQECVFIDDLPRNIEAAKKTGMKGILFHTHEQAVKDLNALLSVR